MNAIIVLVIPGLMGLYLGIGLGIYLVTPKKTLNYSSIIDKIGTETFMIISFCSFWPMFLPIIRKEQNIPKN